MKIQHEKNEVLIPCIKACKWLLSQGVIIEFKRLDAMDYMHIKGSPDLELRFVKDGTLHLLFIECKRKDGKGVQLESQKAYQKKYELCHNVLYELVESDKEMKRIVEKCTGFYEDIINKIEL